MTDTRELKADAKVIMELLKNMSAEQKAKFEGIIAGFALAQKYENGNEKPA